MPNQPAPMPLDGEYADMEGTCPHGISAMEAYFVGCPQCTAEIEQKIKDCEASGGHYLQDAGSYCNGDTAKDIFECTKCPYSFSHTYY